MPKKKSSTKKPASRPSDEQATGAAASQRIDQRIQDLGDWRGETLARMRALILKADPAITEEVKWRGTPVWSRGGILCTGETYAKVVKLTFAHGAKLADPAGLFNSSLEGNTRRAIDIQEGDRIDASAFKSLIKAAVAHNLAAATTSKKTRSTGSKAEPVKLLSGGNPQIAKADGDAPVQAFIAAMPGWQHAVGRRLDALIVRTVPLVRKAVRWNTPFYGIEGEGWFLGFHCFTKYVKVAFLNGSSLQPLPPIAAKHEATRYLHIFENDSLDEVLLANWLRQASQLPGEPLF